MAERGGFEPSVVLPTHAFQACALNHSAISPLSAKAWLIAGPLSILKFSLLAIRVQLNTVSECLRAPWSQKQGLFSGYEVFREGAKNCARGGRAPQGNFGHTDTVSSCALAIRQLKEVFPRMRNWPANARANIKDLFPGRFCVKSTLWKLSPSSPTN
jgi:hypothetical protein